MSLLIRKLRLCCVVFDFEVPGETRCCAAGCAATGSLRPATAADDANATGRRETPEVAKAKEVKREILLELVDSLGKYRCVAASAVARPPSVLVRWPLGLNHAAAARAGTRSRSPSLWSF